MYYVAETDQLIADGVIDRNQAEEIKSRARAAMVALCVNTLLIGGIIAATFGLVFFLADAMSVAVCGGLFLGGGLLILRYGDALATYLQRSVDEVRWGQRVRNPDAMALISVDDVRRKVEAALGNQT